MTLSAPGGGDGGFFGSGAGRRPGGGAPTPARTGGDDAPVKTVRRDEPKVGRNDPCPCGSGKKYKKCHGARTVDTGGTIAMELKTATPAMLQAADRARRRP